MAAFIVVLLAVCLLQHSSGRTHRYPYDEERTDDVAVQRLGKVLEHIVDSLTKDNDKETTTTPKPQAYTKNHIGLYKFPPNPNDPSPQYFFPHQIPGKNVQAFPIPNQGCNQQRANPNNPDKKYLQAPVYPYPTNNQYLHYPSQNAYYSYTNYPGYPTNNFHNPYDNYPNINNNVFPPTCPSLPYLPPPDFPPSNFPPSFPPTNFPPSNFPPSNFPSSNFPPPNYPNHYPHYPNHGVVFPPFSHPTDLTPQTPPPLADDQQQPPSSYSHSVQGVVSKELKPSTG